MKMLWANKGGAGRVRVKFIRVWTSGFLGDCSISGHMVC